jgi:hypothetical protein
MSLPHHELVIHAQFVASKDYSMRLSCLFQQVALIIGHVTDVWLVLWLTE